MHNGQRQRKYGQPNDPFQLPCTGAGGPFIRVSAANESTVVRLQSLVNAAGDAGNTSPAMFGQPVMKYPISPAKVVKFLQSHAKRRGS